MRITKQWLLGKNACDGGLDFYDTHVKSTELSDVLSTLIEHKKYEYASWLIIRILSHDNCIRYAIYSAENVIDIYEKKFPTDDRPRKAIEAAKTYLADKSEKNRKAVNAAYAVANAAYAAAAYTANAAANAAYAAAYAAYAAAYAAADYTDYTDYADTAAAYAAAAYATRAAYDAVMPDIVNYGVELLKQEGVI